MTWKEFSGAFHRAFVLLPSFAPALVPAMLAVMMVTAAAQDGGRLDSRRAASLVLQREGNFFVGGSYNARDQFVGQMYVEYRIPRTQRHAYPIILVHGGGQIGAGWNETPDGREGWTQYFLRQGYAVYVVDQPARGRSAYNSDLGPLSDPFDAVTAQQLWAAPERFDLWPAARLHTQWVGPAVKGDETFDQFMRAQSDALPLTPLDLQERLTADALVALLDRIGPAILVPHSQPGFPSWLVVDRRPDLVKALVQLEPGGPPVFALAPLFSPVRIAWGLTSNPITYSPSVSDPSQLSFTQVPVDDPYVTTCWVQAEPARQLPNLQRVPILMLTSEAGYNTLWDPCTVAYLEQAGVNPTWLRLPDLGIRGNGHFYFIEKNSDEVAGVVLRWLKEHTE
ncbi:alpha/beta hydrolase [Paracraurococcus lichenis]|uniref:Alpha/beta hydrolase n=1 Tax=Paracraurococcus lichenis TaxID=3064888 RepID=A0ABT9EDJ1_9PROT|nr:alpha/beta hydrolase [Paracraurococcus sp. LOR1-02]MDO9714038.1 alpha/beta hydrolase [Paracraurococcus sp. LOR1-02]